MFVGRGEGWGFPYSIKAFFCAGYVDDRCSSGHLFWSKIGKVDSYGDHALVQFRCKFGGRQESCDGCKPIQPIDDEEGLVDGLSDQNLSAGSTCRGSDEGAQVGVGC